MTQNVNEVHIKWHELFKSIPGLKARQPNKVVIEREVIPIIFVPGIMGSRLKNSNDEKVWDPDAALFMLGNYGMFYVTPEKRKGLVVGEKFNKDFLTVLNDDSDHNSKKFGKFKNADKRGWGGISWSSYGKFLEKLEEYTFSNPIQECFEFPLHACGYNWTASNYDSGLELKNYIDKTIEEYSSQGRMCEKVILITHSMGGLVARSATCLHGAEGKVLGVLHGVQPATGSAAAYWRMKAGFERPEGGPTNTLWDWLRHPVKMTGRKVAGTAAVWVLGTNGEEVTSLLANMPGGLELLPTKEYTDNEGSKQWLNYEDSLGVKHSLPKSDPYSEIYLVKDVFYRLIDPLWLGKNIKHEDDFSLSQWDLYEQNLEKAIKLHDELEKKLHSETFQFFAKGIPSADKIIFEHEEYTWGDTDSRGGFQIIVDADGKIAKVDPQLMYVSDEEEYQDLIFYGNLDPSPDIQKTWLHTLKYPDGSGDGTVPISSSTVLDVSVTGWDDDTDEEETDAFGAPTTDYNSTDGAGTTISISAEDGEDWFDIGHEPIYKTKTAQNISFSAIENFCLIKIREKTEV
ncbi:PUTATIVE TRANSMEMBRANE PROTEIN [hydrothermal vent metagenome]|uniref:PUTATIVE TRANSMEMBRANE PROTEIN n=1 Tax=hydrothermal vent metagenome TaxID=652676 RepID=A0A3B1A219_9ZZZZ